MCLQQIFILNRLISRSLNFIAYLNKNTDQIKMRRNNLTLQESGFSAQHC